MNDLSTLIEDLDSPRVLVEVAALVLSLALAWGVARLLGRGQPRDSIWFGRRTVDGVLFPALALALAFAARQAISPYQHVAVLKVAVPLLLSLLVIRLLARVLTVTFPDSTLVRLTERLVSWVAWLAAVLWTVGLLQPVLAEMEAITLTFGKSHVSLRTIIDGVLSSGLVLVLVLWFSATLEQRVLSKAVDDLSMRKVLTNVLRSSLLLLGLLFALSAVGVDLTALSVLGGALGVGLGFGLQKLAANYVSGFVILLERSLRIGDSVKVDGFEGRITDIKTRYTLVRALNGRESVVPNELLITQRVENLSLADPKILLTSLITVGYDSDVATVQAILCQAAQDQPRVLSEPAPVAHLSNFLPDGLEFTLAFWIADPENGQLNVRSAVHIGVLNGLRAASIDIPYPQRVVRLSGTFSPSQPPSPLPTPPGGKWEL